jgi:hypothetical protein
MKRELAILTLIAATIYGMAAYTRPQEPAGKYLHGTILPGIRAALPECPRVPFSGLLQLNGYQHRPTGKPLEVVPATATPYSPEELAEIYSTH